MLKRLPVPFRPERLLDFALLAALWRRGRFEQARQRGGRILDDDQPFFLGAALSWRLALRRFGHGPHARVNLSGSGLGRKMPEPGLEPGRLLTQPRGCKPRTSTNFVTRAFSGSAGTAAGRASTPSPLLSWCGPPTTAHILFSRLVSYRLWPPHVFPSRPEIPGSSTYKGSA